MSSLGSDGSDDQSADAQQQIGSFSSTASWFNEVVVKVDCEYMDFYRDPKRGPTRSTKQQIYDRYCQLQYRKDGKTRQFISEWLHCESGMRVYTRFDLVPPGLHCDPGWVASKLSSFVPKRSSTIFADLKIKNAESPTYPVPNPIPYPQSTRIQCARLDA